MAAVVVSRFKADTVNLLNEVYQAYKSLSIAARAHKDISIELLWATKSVENQPFKAGIDLFINVRAIGKTEEAAAESVRPIRKLFENTLTLQKYEFENMYAAEMEKVVAGISNDAIRAIVKEENTETLQNAAFPYCYAYDLFPFSENDLSRIAGMLIDHPNTAVSFQLIPTMFSQEEIAEIDRISQALDMLSKGVSDAEIGRLSFVAAKKQNEVYKFYSQRKRAPLFLYNALVFGDHNAVASLASGVYGQLATGEDASANLKYITLSPDQIRKDESFHVLPWLLNERIMSAGRNASLWSFGLFSGALARLPYIITTDEAAGFFRLPVGSDTVNAGFKVNQSDKSSKTYGSNLINAGDITVGRLRASSKGDSIVFSLKDLAKHMLVVGTPGSGKTTFSVSLLDRLWKEHHIPFLVIEPAKNEYRSLVQSIN